MSKRVRKPYRCLDYRGKGFRADQRELDAVTGDLRTERVYLFDRELGLNGLSFDEVPVNPSDTDAFDRAHSVYEAYQDGLISSSTRDSLLGRLDHPGYLLAQQGKEKLYGHTRLLEELEALDREAIDSDSLSRGCEAYNTERRGILSTFGTPMEALVDANQAALYPEGKTQWDVRDSLNRMRDYFG